MFVCVNVEHVCVCVVFWNVLFCWVHSYGFLLRWQIWMANWQHKYCHHDIKKQKSHNPYFNNKKIRHFGWVDSKKSPEELHWGPVPGGGQFLGRMEWCFGDICRITYKYRCYNMYIYIYIFVNMKYILCTCKYDIHLRYLRHDTYMYMYIYIYMYTRFCWIGYMLVSDLWYWESCLVSLHYSRWLVMCSS